MSKRNTTSGVAEGPLMSLRGGAAIDDNRTAPEFDEKADRPSPEFLEKYHWGILI